MYSPDNTMPGSDYFFRVDGKGGFSVIPGRESGFFADGDAKGMAELDLKDGSSLILVARNSDSLKVIRTLRPTQKTIRIKNDEVSAELTLQEWNQRVQGILLWQRLSLPVIKSLSDPGGSCLNNIYDL